METNSVAKSNITDYLKADIDDIIFEYRNKSYGGYLLRKLYPSNMTKGNIVATLLFILGITIPLIAKFVKDRLPEEELINAEVTLAEPPPLDPKAPPPPPPPPPPAPPKKATIAFVKPVVKKDEEVTEEVAPPDVDDLKDIEISTKTQEGTNDGVPDGLDEPVEEAPPAVVEEVKKEEPEEVFKVVEQKPEYPDGEAAMLKFIYENIKYPNIARENGVEGTVYVRFVVEKDGSVSNVEVVRDIGGGCGEEAMRVVKKFPKWNPGKQRGRAVRVFFNLPVKFKLE
ncbi:MAG: energy transducer TonB [Saprospiraceae bacterium]|nr:energy transducer TonB [Saprospiraceae bacterium]